MIQVGLSGREATLNCIAMNGILLTIESLCHRINT